MTEPSGHILRDLGKIEASLERIDEKVDDLTGRLEIYTNKKEVEDKEYRHDMERRVASLENSRRTNNAFLNGGSKAIAAGTAILTAVAIGTAWLAGVAFKIGMLAFAWVGKAS